MEIKFSRSPKEIKISGGLDLAEDRAQESVTGDVTEMA